ncbi:hypothetical protein RQP46_007664 [Phenoliferia psychrophenolica]
MHDELEKAKEQRATPRRPSGRAARPSAATGVTLKGFLARVGVFYLLIAYFIVCPTDSTRERLVCRSLDTVQQRLVAYEPTVRPYVLTAQRKLDPYLAQAHVRIDPYLAIAQPYFARASQVARPVASRAAAFYHAQAHPRILTAISKSHEATKPYLELAKAHYRRALAPSVEWYSHAAAEWYRREAAPHLAVVAHHAQTYSKQAYDVTSPLYYKGLPFLHKHYLETILPTAQTTFRATHKTYVNEVHPRLLVAGGHAHGFYKSKILPALHRFYSLYVAPQVGKINAKIFEYKTKKEQTDAVAHVVEAEAEILKEHGAEDLEDFIAELRDTTYVDASAEPEPPAPSAEPVPTAEELKAATAEKRAALEALSTSYEKEIAKLGHTQQELFIQRLVEIRATAQDDIPMRFTATTIALDEEGDKMVGRLGKYFDRVAADDKLSTDEKVQDAEFLATKATAKVRKMAADALSEVADYRQSLANKEQAAVELSSEAMSALVSKAQEELSFGWTWLDDVRHSDWQRYHQLAKAETNAREYIVGLQTGAIADDALAPYNPSAQLDAVEGEIKDIVSAFEKVLSKITLKGTRELKGEWTGVVNEAQKVAEKLADVVDVAKSSVSSLAGVTPTPSDLPGTVSSLASVAQESAATLLSSARDALPTIPAVALPTDVIVDSYSAVTENVGSVVEQAATKIDQATSAVDSAVESIATALPIAVENIISLVSSVGAEALIGAGSSVSQLASVGQDAASVVSSYASPHSAFDSPTPLASQASSVGSSAASVAASVFAEASQTVLRAAGLEPSPTDLAQTVSSIADVASSKASEAYSEAQVTATSVVAVVESSITSLASVASSLAAPHPAFTDSAASVAASKAADIHEEL